VLRAVLERILAGQVGTFSIAGSRAWVEPRHERGHEQAQPTTEHAREVGLRNAHLLHLEPKRGRAGLWFLPSMPIQLHPNTHILRMTSVAYIYSPNNCYSEISYHILSILAI